MFILRFLSDKTIAVLELNAEGVVLSHQHANELSACPKIPVDETVIALFPGEEVSTYDIAVPRMRASEKQQAIPYLLEEQLADLPENNYVVTGDVVEGKTRVVVTDKNKLQAYIAQMHEAQIYPRCFLPDFLALRLQPETWSVLVESSVALVRLNNQNGFCVDVANLPLLLSLQLNHQKIKPKKILLWQEKQIIELAQLQTLGVPVEIQDESQQSYFDFKSLFLNPPLSFLQGKYKPKSEKTILRKNWMWCGAMVAAWIFLSLCGYATEYFYYHHVSSQLEKKITLVYQELFPGSVDVLEPRFRTAGLLKRFDLAYQNTSFLRLLNTTGKILLQFPDIKVNQVAFSSGELQLTLNATAVNQLGQLSEALRKKSLSVSQKVLAANAHQLSAQVSVKEQP